MLTLNLRREEQSVQSVGIHKALGTVLLRQRARGGAPQQRRQNNTQHARFPRASPGEHGREELLGKGELQTRLHTLMLYFLGVVRRIPPSF